MYMFEKSHPKKWKTHLLPGKLSFSPDPANLARDLSVLCGNLLFPRSELEMASGMLCVISLLKNLIGFFFGYAWNPQPGIWGFLQGVHNLLFKAFLPLLLLTFSQIEHTWLFFFFALWLSKFPSMWNAIPSSPTVLLLLAILLFLNEGLDSS